MIEPDDSTAAQRTARSFTNLTRTARAAARRLEDRHQARELDPAALAQTIALVTSALYRLQALDYDTYDALPDSTEMELQRVSDDLVKLWDDDSGHAPREAWVTPLPG